MGKTLSEKVWDAHVVRAVEGEPDLLYIDLHLVHEVTSPQAFDGLRLAGRPVRRPDLTLATEDHNTPTLNINLPIADPVSRTQVDTLRKNAAEFGIRIHSLGDRDQAMALYRAYWQKLPQSIREDDAIRLLLVLATTTPSRFGEGKVP